MAPRHSEPLGADQGEHQVAKQSDGDDAAQHIIEIMA